MREGRLWEMTKSNSFLRALAKLQISATVPFPARLPLRHWPAPFLMEASPGRVPLHPGSFTALASHILCALVAFAANRLFRMQLVFREAEIFYNLVHR